MKVAIGRDKLGSMVTNYFLVTCPLEVITQTSILHLLRNDREVLNHFKQRVTMPHTSHRKYFLAYAKSRTKLVHLDFSPDSQEVLFSLYFSVCIYGVLAQQSVGR